MVFCANCAAEALNLGNLTNVSTTNVKTVDKLKEYLKSSFLLEDIREF